MQNRRIKEFQRGLPGKIGFTVADLSDGEVAAWDAATQKWGNAANGGGGGAVTSVFGRTGAVVAVAGDYDALEVSYDDTGDAIIAATTVDGALEDLDAAVAAIPDWYFQLTATNRVIGSDAGSGNLADNVFLAMSGAGAGLAAIHDDVIAIGVNALASASDATAGRKTIQGTIAIGFEALNTIDSTVASTFEPNNPASHIAIGHQALKAIDRTSRTHNVAIGHQVLAANTGGSGVGKTVAIGALVGTASTTGMSESVLIGWGVATASGANGISNVGIGSEALIALTSGSSNTVVGTGSGQGITSGAGNCILGTDSGTGVSTFSDNILIGSGVLASGNGNIILGHEGDSGSTGEYNVLIGHTIGAAITTGIDRIVALGPAALKRHTRTVAQTDGFFVESLATPNSSVGASNPVRRLLYGEIDVGNLAVGSANDANDDPTTASENFGTSTVNGLMLIDGTAPSSAPGHMVLIFNNAGGASGQQTLTAYWPDGSSTQIAANP